TWSPQGLSSNAPGSCRAKPRRVSPAWRVVSLMLALLSVVAATPPSRSGVAALGIPRFRHSVSPIDRPSLRHYNANGAILNMEAQASGAIIVTEIARCAAGPERREAYRHGNG